MPSSPNVLPTPTSAPELFDLFDAILENRADTEMYETLRVRCEYDLNVRAAYVAYLGIHAELMWQQRGSIIAVSDSAVEQAAHHFITQKKHAQQALSFPVVRVVLAASIIIGLIFFLMVTSPQSQQLPVNGPQPAATVLRSFNAEWADDQHLAIGTALSAADYILQYGMVDMELYNGVQLTLHAPCSLTLANDNSVTLKLGALTAEVPQSAHGFSVFVPQGRVIDHGTLFTTVVEADGETEVHVLKGEVAVALQPLSGTAQSTTVTSGQALRFSGIKNTVNAIDFNPTIGSRPFGQHGITTMSLAMRLIEPAPASVKPGALESNTAIALIREQHPITTPYPVRVTMPGRDDGSRAPIMITLPAHTRVDSYLFHFDPVGAPSQAVQVIGSVTFDQPIVGTFFINQHLANSHGLFSHPTMAYHDKDVRQGIEEEDSVTVSADGRTIRVMMSVREQQTDQIRVLVAHP